MRLDVGYKSVQGSTHPYEDRILVDKERNLFAVADGVTISSQGSGGIAAEIAVTQLRKLFEGNLVKAVLDVNRYIVEVKSKNKGVGETTLTACHIDDARAEIVSVGDSPAFLIRRNRLIELTESDRSPWGGLTQVIGYAEYINPHRNVMEVQPEDILIVCSDGIIHIFAQGLLIGLQELSKPTEIAEKLISLAIKYPSGYDDDKSVIVIKVV